MNSAVFLVYIIFFIFFCLFVGVDGRGDRKESALDDESYKLFARIIRNGGKLDTKVKERTKIERSILRRYQRYCKTHSCVELSGDSIFIDGKRLLRKTELKETVTRLVQQSKGSSARYCAKRLALSLLGGGVKGVQKVINGKKVCV